MQAAYQFDGVDLPQYDSLLPLSGGPAIVPIAQVSGGGAVNLLGASGEGVPGGRAYRYQGSFVEDDIPTLQAKIDAITAKIGHQGQFSKTILADSTRRWVDAVLLDVPGDITPETVLELGLTLDLYILTPYWHAQTQVELSYSDLYDEDDDLPTCGAEGPALGTAITLPVVVNDGDKPVLDAIFTLTAAGAAPITAATIANTTTGHTMLWSTSSLAVGKDLVIDCGEESVENDGTDEYHHFTRPATKERWMEIAPGNNTFTVTLAGGDGALQIDYCEAFAT